MRYFSCFLFVFTFNFLVLSQVTPSEFNSTEYTYGNLRKSIKYNNDIIIAGEIGQSPNYSSIKHYMIRIDENGNEIWNFNDVDSILLGDQFINFIDGKDGYLYAELLGYQTFELCKIDASNGQLIWQKDLTNLMYFSSSTVTLNAKLLNIDEDRILISYNTNYNGFAITAKLSTVSKENGLFIETRTLGSFPNGQNNYVVVLDENHDIYYTKQDSLFKINSNAINSAIWSRKFPVVELEQVCEVFIDSLSDQILYIGKSTVSGFKFLKLNKTNGNLISFDTENLGDYYLKFAKKRENFLYLTWGQMVNDGLGKTTVTKYNITSENVEFHYEYDFPDGVNGSGREVVISLELDDSGDIFLTGCYGYINNESPNYNESNLYFGNWGVIKVDGITGNTIYVKTIKNELNLAFEQSSSGRNVFIINNTPCFVGLLQAKRVVNCFNIYFLKLDNLSGNIINSKTFGTELKFQSKTIDIQNYGVNNTLLFKQIGRYISLEMYDLSKQLLWKKDFSGKEYLKGSAIEILPNGNIVIAATKYSIIDSPPYYFSTSTFNIEDSAYVYLISPTGALVSLHGFSAYGGTPELFYDLSDQRFEITELVCDNAVTMVFYHIGDTLCHRRIANSYVSFEELTPTIYESIDGGVNYAVNKDVDNILIVGKINNEIKLFNLEKMSMIQTELATLTIPISTVSRVKYIEPDKLLILGKTLDGYESICLYNSNSLVNEWTKVFPSTSNSITINGIVDTIQSVIYTIGSSDSNIVIRKTSLLSGDSIWTSIYNGAAGLNDYPYSISLDKFRNQIIVIGFEEDFLGNKSPTVLTLDTAGNILDSLNLINDFQEDAIALCSEVLPDGSHWVGGYRNISNLTNAGFLMETKDSFIPPCVPTPINVNVFSIPSDVNNCIGGVNISIAGVPNFILTLDNLNSYISNGNTIIQNLCPGIHSLQVNDNCLDSVITTFVIPIDSNFVYNNPFLDSIAVDSLGVTLEDCTINYNSIDTAFISSISNIANSISVIWTIFDSNGAHYDTTSYVLNNGNGVYLLQLSIFCPTKSLGNYFSVTEAIYFDGEVSMATMNGIKNDSKIKIYPNPIKDELYIDSPWNNSVLTIFDAYGRAIKSLSIQKQAEVWLGDYKTGVYFLEFSHEGKKEIKKIIKY